MGDRLKEFREKYSNSDSFINASNLEEGLANLINGNVIMEMDTFNSQEEKINENMKKIKTFEEQIEKLHKQLLATQDIEEAKTLSQKVEILTGSINTMLRETKALLAQIDSDTQRLAPLAPPGSADLRARITHHRGLVSKFSKLAKKLSDAQYSIRQKYKLQMERQYKIVNPRATKEDIARLGDGEDGMQQIFTSAAKGEARKNLQQLQDRQKDVKKIEKNMTELLALFQELQNMVIEQGEIINKIEYNIDTIEGYTEKAAKQLTEAVASKKNYQKKSWVLLICTIFLFLFFCIIFYILLFA